MQFRGRDAGRRVAAVVLVIGIVAAGAGYLYVDGAAGSSPTGEAVKAALELVTDSDLQVLNVEDRGSLDRVVLSDGSNVLNAFVTDDGRYLIRATQQGQVVQGFAPLNNLTRTLEARNRFISCLDNNNATFYGLVSGSQSFAPYVQSVQTQAQVLGGQRAMQLFGGAGPQQVRQLVLAYNQTRGIVWQVNDSIEAGIQTIPMLEQRSGCAYTVNSSDGSGLY